MSTKKMLSNAEIASFCEQISLILDAGITPVEGIGILLSDSKNEKGYEILETISEHCNRGESFYDSVKASRVFPAYMLNMIAIGEEAGRLDLVLRSLASYYEREETIQSNLKSAVRYPLIMIVMMFLVILVLLTKVLPIFNQVFVQLGTEMNPISLTFMNAGRIISRFSVLFLLLTAVCLILFFYLSKTEKGHELYLRCAMNFPFTREFYTHIFSGRFASGMALTLSSGLDTFTSLGLVKQLVNSPFMGEKIDSCRSMIQNGASFAEALTASNIFNNLYSHMISIGFKTGNIDVVMDKIARNYEKETDSKIYNIISVLEPTLVIVLSFIVGLILLSVILPLMGIMSSIG